MEIKMGWIDNILGRMGYGRKTAQVPTTGWLRAEADEARFNLPDGSIWENQVDLYRRLSWVMIAVQSVAQSCAAVKVSVKRMEGEEEVDIPNHDFEELMRRPNPLQSRYELLEATFSYHALTGNAYWWLNRDGEEETPKEIWSIPSYKITPVPDEKLFIKGYLYSNGGADILLKPWQIVHFKRFNPLSIYVGLSPIEALATVAVGDMGMQNYNTKLFTKSNARLPGILAFADPVLDSDWEKIKTDITNKAMERQMMILRNVGKGGVEWIQAALSNADMEFIAGRKMNKQEIFDTFAPGLYAMLSENATEANSRTAKATFTEFCLWPLLNMAGEKITNDILTAYGKKLVAEFDDIRYTDRQMQLQESQEYARTHSIDEIRKEKYGDGPLGDERGEMLPAQIGSAPVGGQTSPEGMVTDHPLQGGNGHEEMTEWEKDELARRLFGGHSKPVEEREIGKGNLALTPTLSRSKSVHGRGEEIEDELRAWEKYEVKRWGKKESREFKCEVIPAEMEAEIRERIKECKTEQDLKFIFQQAESMVEGGGTVSVPYGDAKNADRPVQLLAELKVAVEALREAE